MIETIIAHRITLNSTRTCLLSMASTIVCFNDPFILFHPCLEAKCRFIDDRFYKNFRSFFPALVCRLRPAIHFLPPRTHRLLRPIGLRRGKQCDCVKLGKISPGTGKSRGSRVPGSFIVAASSIQISVNALFQSNRQNQSDTPADHCLQSNANGSRFRIANQNCRPSMY